MSHAATAWASKQKHLKPAQKIVLLALADCHNPAHGCFPGQRYLAEFSNICPRSVRDQLTILEKLGLITRTHRKKVNTKHVSDRYELHFDREMIEPGKPAAKIAASTKKPAANHDKSQRQKLPPNLVKEIGNNARGARAPARKATARPAPQCQVCVLPGSHNENRWDDWLREHGFPPLSVLAPRIGDGFDAPFAVPPASDHPVQNDIAIKWAKWCSDRRQNQAA
ncbi:MAG: helix-turn-helix domain-containing protein [Dinoroseobacter sp.]|nr:helix-turn-helix domain-containing protein [Dinoroseobacter sp.]